MVKNLKILFLTVGLIFLNNNFLVGEQVENQNKMSE